MTHPGHITLFHAHSQKTWIIDADRISEEARYASVAGGRRVPIVAVLELEDGRLAAYGPNRQFLGLTS